MSERARKLYEEAFGRETLERQQQLAKDYWTCCGEHRVGPHHIDCAKHVEPEQTVHEDQETLL